MLLAGALMELLGMLSSSLKGSDCRTLLIWKVPGMQELKGNIRVFCRVRPLLDSDIGAGPQSLQYPNSGLP